MLRRGAMVLVLAAAAAAAAAQPTAMSSPSPSAPGGGMQGMQQGGCPECEQMMKAEMAMYPWKVAAVSAFTVLSIAALALLVVLEALWIRWWLLRLKNLRRTTEGDGQ